MPDKIIPLGGGDAQAVGKCLHTDEALPVYAAIPANEGEFAGAGFPANTGEIASVNTRAIANVPASPGTAPNTTPDASPDWVARDGLSAPHGTRRVLLTLSYDGTAYAGWQRQQNAMAVQQKVEAALFALTGEPIRVTGASRTDAGVHALGQRAHFDTASRIPAERFSYALNTHLPSDIRAIAAREVNGCFHARFDAKGKQYVYRIHNAPHASALCRHLTAHVPMPLSAPAMCHALPALLGTHDFAAFQASGGTAKTTVRRLTQAALTHEGDELTLTISGNAFLYNMVRVIAGTLIEVGKGKLTEDCFLRALQTGNRLLLGPTAPACGLTLVRVYYQPEDDLPM